jgi:putative oxygen-independent coproporphyrinogen III oxidase
MGRPPLGDEPTGLTSAALVEAAGRPLSLYVHVPFCASRCGYCDFNTYTAAELGSAPGGGQDSYLAAVRREIVLASERLGPDAPVSTVFFGGGTPTLLPPEELVGVLDALRARFALDAECEITTEANPESVSLGYLERLREGGFTRLSLGMQSATPHVLTTLQRRHSPGQVSRVVAWARAAGFDSVSLDLIYGTPGESMADWDESLAVAVACDVDHVSAYSLIVEEGTAFGAALRRGELREPDADDLADKYLRADAALSASGLQWYELSNWSRPGHECRHNLAYWRGDSWWGIGPGAHSHIGGVRWWNVTHPRTYASALAEGRSPAQAQETLDAAARHLERILLEIRLAGGLPLDALTASEATRVPALVTDGLATLAGARVILTPRGRLLADAIVRDLAD